MKHILVLIIAFMGLTTLVNAQKYAFVDTEYILDHIPAYKSAQEKLDRQSELWQKEIESKYKEVGQLYKKYQEEEVLMTAEMKKKRQEEIVNREKEVKKLQQKYFGPEGELNKKRQELIKPIQDEVFNAVKEISAEGNFAVIFDTAAGMSILYANPKYDKSDDILKKLGYKN